MSKVKQKEGIAAILKSFETDRLLKLMALHARKHCDGHFTVFSFTAGYKAAFGTPNLDTGEGRSQLLRLQECPRIKDALVNALLTEDDFYETLANEDEEAE